jgi:hypothetical protein
MVGTQSTRLGMILNGMGAQTHTGRLIMATERRKNRRYGMPVKSLKAVVVANRKRISVKDISMGGLMVEYVPDAYDPIKTELIDVVAMADNQVYLPKIRCRTVYDILTLAENKAFSGEVIRRRGLKFVGLTKRQAGSLGIIIERFRNTSSGG